MLIPKAHKVAVYSKLFQGELQRAAGSSLREKNFSLRCPLRVPRPPWGPASSTHGNKTRVRMRCARSSGRRERGNSAGDTVAS